MDKDVGQQDIVLSFGTSPNYISVPSFGPIFLASFFLWIAIGIGVQKGPQKMIPKWAPQGPRCRPPRCLHQGSRGPDVVPTEVPDVAPLDLLHPRWCTPICGRNRTPRCRTYRCSASRSATHRCATHSLQHTACNTKMEATNCRHIDANIINPDDLGRWMAVGL